MATRKMRGGRPWLVVKSQKILDITGGNEVVVTSLKIKYKGLKILSPNLYSSIAIND